MPVDDKLWIPPLSPTNQKKANKRQKYQGLVTWSGFPGKTLWDWLQLLAALAIPVVIAIGTMWFSAQQSEASSRASDKQHQTDLQIAQDQQQETALQAYLDRMTELLLNNKLLESKPGDAVRNVARARTLTVLPQLSGTRKGKIVRFLYEAGLIARKNTIVSLQSANLSSVDLANANLIEANLSGTNLDSANLTGANLFNANLSDIDPDNVNISGPYPNDVCLGGTYIDYRCQNITNLSNANLGRANLERANLGGAVLFHANLRGTNLIDANLGRALIIQEQGEAFSLHGATMPDGSKHP